MVLYPTHGEVVGRERQSMMNRVAMQTRVVSAALTGAMLLSREGNAQESGKSTSAVSAGESDMAEVHVTGSRVARDASQAPTPVTTIGQEDIRAQGTPNIADFVNTLPSVRGSSTATNSAGSLSNGL